MDYIALLYAFIIFLFCAFIIIGNAMNLVIAHILLGLLFVVAIVLGIYSLIINDEDYKKHKR